MDNSERNIVWEIGSAIDVGRKRKGKPNQDSLDVILPDDEKHRPPLLVIADGMGGHQGGARASSIVTQIFRGVFTAVNHPTEYKKLLELCATKSHESVRVHGAQDSSLANMGSTVVAAVLEEKRVSLVNVGDSRAYILRGNKTIQISQDQSFVAEQVRAGLITPEQAQVHPKRNQLTMAINARRPEIKPYSTEFKLEPDDILVLCSDGLWGPVPEMLIWAAASELPPQQAAEKLVAQANSKQGPDNISVIIARRYNPDRETASFDMEDTNPGV